MKFGKKSSEQIKVIFLDIDGVLNNPKQWGNRFLDLRFDEECVNQFNRIVEATNAKIVLSTSWRKLYKYDILTKVLKDVGVRGEFIGITPALHSLHSQRGDEINEWIKYYGRKNIDSFVVLDDDSDMDKVLGHFVKCNTILA